MQITFGMVKFFPLSRLRRQLSQRESQVPRGMHYTERCIELSPCYLFDKLEVIALLLLYLSQNTFYYKCYCYKGSYKGIVV